MARIRSLLVVGIALGAMSLQASTFEFQWAQPRPTGNLLTGCSFADAMHGLCVGEFGTVLHTDDGGTSWTLVPGTWTVLPQLSDVLMLDALTAIAVGEGERLYRSTDGGATWTPVSAPGGLPLDDIARAGTDLVVVGAGGTVLRSSDDGLTWTAMPFSGDDHLTRSYWLDGQRGFVVSGTFQELGTVVARTVDGGSTWTPLVGVLPHTARNVAFLDDTTGFVLTDGDTYRSDDGGATWTNLGLYFQSYANNLVFLDDQTWLVSAFGEGAVIDRTVDAGAEFSIAFYDLALQGVTTLQQIPGGRVVATLPNGGVVTSDDDGLTWTVRVDDAADGRWPTLRTVRMTEGGRAYAGADTTQGPNSPQLWLESGDHGRTWHQSATPPPLTRFRDILCVSNQHTLVSGTVGWSDPVIARTVDGGLTWGLSTLPPGDGPMTLALAGPSRVFVTALFGSNGGTHVYRSDDGGATWQDASIGLAPNQAYLGISFVDADHGFVSGGFASGVVSRTADGGDTWQSLPSSGLGGYARWLWFADEQIGLASCGDGIYRTEDGGMSWTLVQAANYGSPLAVDPSGRGFALDGFDGTLFTTGDAGLTWETAPLPWRGGADVAVAGTDFVVVGEYASILHGEVLGATAVDPLPAPGAVSLRAAPNPFNPRVELQLAIPRDGQVRVDIFDARGRRVRALAIGEVTAGTHTWTWNGQDDAGRALPSGLYLARATGLAGSASTKLTLVR